MRSICFSYFFFFIQFRSEEIYLFAHRKSHSMRWVVSHALGTAILARFDRCVWGVWDVGVYVCVCGVVPQLVAAVAAIVVVIYRLASPAANYHLLLLQQIHGITYTLHVFCVALWRH